MQNIHLIIIITLIKINITDAFLPSCLPASQIWKLSSVSDSTIMPTTHILFLYFVREHYETCQLNLISFLRHSQIWKIYVFLIEI